MNAPKRLRGDARQDLGDRRRGLDEQHGLVPQLIENSADRKRLAMQGLVFEGRGRHIVPVPSNGPRMLPTSYPAARTCLKYS